MAVSANNDCWRFYASGILSDVDDCPTNIDHAVVVVGVETAKLDLDDSGSTKNCRRATRSEFRT